mmetsp:Transcript_61435/g.176230  ORF Transcript_61435/g.176230 Transcript_61435/m.176230 type:complete len:202 (+) Transcript_61435:683-1288(+)
MLSLVSGIFTRRIRASFRACFGFCPSGREAIIIIAPGEGSNPNGKLGIVASAKSDAGICAAAIGEAAFGSAEAIASGGNDMDAFDIPIAPPPLLTFMPGFVMPTGTGPPPKPPPIAAIAAIAAGDGIGIAGAGIRNGATALGVELAKSECGMMEAKAAVAAFFSAVFRSGLGGKLAPNSRAETHMSVTVPIHWPRPTAITL